MTVSFYL